MEVSVIDLTERVGLPVKLVPAEEGWQLEIGEGVLHEKPAVRLISDLKPVMKNPDANTPRWLYWMYRDVRLPEHEAQIAASGLRYDLTVFNPGVLCVEVTQKMETSGTRLRVTIIPMPVQASPFPKSTRSFTGAGCSFCSSLKMSLPSRRK